MRREMFTHGLRPPLVRFDTTIATAQTKVSAREAA